MTAHVMDHVNRKYKLEYAIIERQTLSGAIAKLYTFVTSCMCPHLA